MASSKKPVYADKQIALRTSISEADATLSYDAFYRPRAETKLVTDRKRRQSDLVIMWHSIIGVTTIILHELWTTLLHMWGFLELWFGSNERFELQTWLEKYLPYVPDDFSNSWRDGRLLAILLNQLQPGCYSDARELDPDYGLRNVYKAFDILERHFGIKPDISAEEIVVCIDGSDIKLFNILLQLKRFTGSQPESKVPHELEEPKESPEVTPRCIAKGTGLAVAFVGRITNFIISCVSITDLDIIIEIKGPTTLCRERITKRSPKKKRSSTSWKFPRLLIRSTSMTFETDHLNSEEETLPKNISLEYEIFENQISVGYRPKEKGQHRVSILWHGQHVSDSPYLVNVEDSLDVTTANHLAQKKSVLKKPDQGENDEMKKNAVRFEQTRVKRKEQPNQLGRVLSRRILRFIVKVNGKDIPISAESTDSLATELLKMEYDIETCPSPHRRNSWGFAGDADRKKSVIRQFGIDINELEAQICMKRTRSLSAYKEPKRILEKSNSLETLNSKLNIVNEVAFESNDNVCECEANYAYINEDSVLVNSETDMNEILEMEMNSKREVETKTSRNFEDSSTKSFTKSMNENVHNKTELHKISFLSTEDTKVYAVDNLNDDLQPDQLFSHLPNNSESYTSRLEPTVKMSLNCEDSSKVLNCNKRNVDDYDYGISKTAKYVCPVCKNFKKKTSRRKQCETNKKHIKTKKGQKTTNQVFLKKSLLSPKAIEVPTVTVRQKWRKVKKPVLERKHSSSLNLIKCLKNLDIVAFKSQKKDNDTDGALINKQITSDKNLETTASLLMIDNPNQESHSHFNEESSLNVNDKRKISNIDHPVENLLNKEQSKYVEKKPNDLTNLQNFQSNGDSHVKVDAKRKISNIRQPIGTMLDKRQSENIDRITKHEIQEPKINKVTVNHTFRPASPSFQSKIKENSVKSETPKALHTHTLRTIELLNLKQFSLPVDPQSSSSPVKSQITQWENNLSSNFPQSISRKTSTTSAETEQVSVKERLAFWENTNKTKNSIAQCVSENNRKISLVDSKHSCKSSESENNVMENDLFNIPRTDEIQSTPASHIKRKVERYSLNTEAAEKDMDRNKTTNFELNDRRIRRRSFSDPCVIETSPEQTWELYLQSSESGKRCSDFSNDNNLELYFSDESDDLSGGCSQHSMSDEYIDDEISEKASEYWGDLSHVKDLKVARCSIDSSFWVTDFLQNQYQQLKSFPEHCKVFGIAVYYGYVALKNRFQVYTGDSGFGSLSVSMQGFRRHDVSLVSVVYVRKDVYEVTYQVMTKGYYLISIRWMEKEIPGSPFVCKVTF